MEQVVLAAELRDASGKGPARRLRRAGLIPGVIYGHGRDTLELSVPLRELQQALRTEQGLNVLLDLRIQGFEADEALAAMIREIQRDPVKHVPLHVDFAWISLTDTIIVRVPVHHQGEAPGLEEGGVLDQDLYEVEVSCRPGAIPEALSVDITGMSMHDTRHVRDLIVPAGVELVTDLDEPVLSIIPPSRVELPEEEVEAVLEGVPGEEEAGEVAAAAEEAEESEE